MKKLTRYGVGLLLAAGVLLGNPVRLSANAAQSSNQFMIAATDFCYAGIIRDPTTGEEIDLYNLCTDNLDLA